MTDKTEYEMGVQNRSTATVFYNLHAETVGKKKVKQFKDTPTALARAKEVQELLAPAPSAPSEKKDGGKKGSHAKRMDGESKIVVLQTENPKRAGSRAFTKYQKLIDADGTTVAEFKAKEGKTPSLDDEIGWPGIELRYAVSKGWVKLEKAS